MKVVVKTGGEDFEAHCDVTVDGKVVAFGYNMGENPEDANLVRDLNFVYGLADVLEAAHKAGKSGEPFEVRRLRYIERLEEE